MVSGRMRSGLELHPPWLLTECREHNIADGIVKIHENIDFFSKIMDF